MTVRADHSRPPFRVGVIGVGTIARIHLPNLHRLAEAASAAICDPDEAHASTAANYGAKPYPDARRILEQQALDAVFVCTPPLTRSAIVERAARRSLHVYVEKPVALDHGGGLQGVIEIERAGMSSSGGFMSLCARG